MAIYQKEENQVTLNHKKSLKLSFTNIQGLCSSFVEWEFFLEPSSPDLLALCERILYDSIDPANFFVMGYLLLIRNDFITHMQFM